MNTTTTKGLDIPAIENSWGFKGKNYLFAIGIDKYEYWSPLKNAVRDVQKFVHILTDRYQFEKKTVTVLKNEEATAKNILTKLEELVEKVTEEDNLVIYFSGHGHYKKATKTGYWVPVDAEEGEENAYQFIRNADIRDLLIAIKSLHTLLIVDSCFSGTFLQQFRSSSTTTRPKAECHQSRMVFTSGRAEQVVSDGLEGGNSPFAKGLLIQLERNTEKYISASKLLHDVKEFVTTETNQKQQPIVKRLPYPHDDEGDFVFHLRISEAEMWSDVVKQHTNVGYKKFIELFPESEHLEEAEENYYWLRADEDNTIKSLKEYWNKYRPDGKYVPQAKERIKGIEEEEVWERAKRRNILSGYLDYLDLYSKGSHTEEARRRIDQMEGDAPDEPPPPIPQAISEEEKAWEKADDAGTYIAYQDFTHVYPDSQFAEQAYKKMKRLDILALKQIQFAEQNRNLSLQEKIDKCFEYFNNYPGAGNHNEVKKIKDKLEIQQYSRGRAGRTGR